MKQIALLSNQGSATSYNNTSRNEFLQHIFFHCLV